MSNFREMKYRKKEPGWIHIYRLAELNETDCSLPPTTIDFLVDFAKTMLNHDKKFEGESRKQYNEQIPKMAMEKLKLISSKKGRTHNKMETAERFSKSDAGKCALTIINKVIDNPLLTDLEAQKLVAEESDITLYSVVRHWTKAKNHPDFEFCFLSHPHIRELAQMEYLANTIANKRNIKSQLPVLGFTTEIPDSVLKVIPETFLASKSGNGLRAPITDGATNKHLEISTHHPSSLQTPEHFQLDSDTPDTRTYFAHVLAQCVLVNNECYTSIEWRANSTPLQIFIGEQIVAKFERRLPHEGWPHTE